MLKSKEHSHSKAGSKGSYKDPVSTDLKYINYIQIMDPVNK